MDICTQLAKQVMLKEVKNRIYNNFMLSPLSINAVLNMVAAGSRGRTLEQFLGFLGSKSVGEINSKSREIMKVAASVGSLPNEAEDGPILAMVNGAWVDQNFPLKPQYQEVLRGIYGCEAKTIDFVEEADKVVSEINSWAEVNSRGLIKNIIQRDSLTPIPALLLANGLYFKGIWDLDYTFDVRCTKNRDFYLLNGDAVSVPFMTSRKRYFGGSFDGFKVLKIPYESGKLKHERRFFSMYFFLPDERDGLQNLLEKFSTNAESLQQKYFNLRKMRLDEFWIPKFKLSCSTDVSKAMEDMGLPLSFLEKRSDFSEMLHIPTGLPLFVSNIMQKAFIEIDEKGTKAAVITGFGFVGSAPPPPEKFNFVADHPFLFMIKEETSGLIFFTGAVLNPTKNDSL